MTFLRSLKRFRALILASLLGPTPASAAELLVAAASNFSAPMMELVERFESQTGHRVNTAFGSSGRLFAQITNGAPFQIFFSADQDKPARLIEAGLAIASSRFTYANGELVLWSADPEREITDSDALQETDVTRIAVANPRIAPYGAAAMEVLEALGLSKQLADRLVQGENIAQTYQFVESGNAQLGFVAKSQVVRSDGSAVGAGWEIPREFYSPIKQDAVLLSRAIDCKVCADFLDFIQQEEQQSLLSSFGYRFD